MPIQKLSIENFTVFEGFAIEFSEGINVIIGENGTGKTHLLKLLYSFCQSETTKTVFIGMEPLLSHSFFASLDRYFFNMTGWIRNKDKPCIASFRSDDIEYSLQCEMNTNKVGLNVYNTSCKKNPQKSVFIPAKEMLTHSGLEKDYASRKLPFDETYIDILNQLGVSAIRSLSNESENILKKITRVIDGKVLYEDGAYFFDRGGEKIGFFLEAEGNKKFGLLYKLIETGELIEGSILFWDEPEANINPKLIPDLVEILLELQRSGVQIVVATHDYIFAKYFEIRAKEDDHIRFHSLYKTENGVECESNPNFRDLKHNPIMEAFDRLLDEVYDLNLGE